MLNVKLVNMAVQIVDRGENRAEGLKVLELEAEAYLVRRIQANYARAHEILADRPNLYEVNEFEGQVRSETFHLWPITTSDDERSYNNLAFGYNESGELVVYNRGRLGFGYYKEDTDRYQIIDQTSDMHKNEYFRLEQDGYRGLTVYRTVFHNENIETGFPVCSLGITYGLDPDNPQLAKLKPKSISIRFGVLRNSIDTTIYSDRYFMFVSPNHGIDFFDLVNRMVDLDKWSDDVSAEALDIDFTTPSSAYKSKAEKGKRESYIFKKLTDPSKFVWFCSRIFEPVEVSVTVSEGDNNILDLTIYDGISTFQVQARSEEILTEGNIDIGALCESLLERFSGDDNFQKYMTDGWTRYARDREDDGNTLD